MDHVIRVVAFSGDKRSPVWQSEQTISMLGQRRIRLTGIELTMAHKENQYSYVYKM